MSTFGFLSLSNSIALQPYSKREGIKIILKEEIKRGKLFE